MDRQRGELWRIFKQEIFPRNHRSMRFLRNAEMPKQHFLKNQGSVCSIRSWVQHLQSLQTWTKWMLPMHRGGCIAPQSSWLAEDLATKLYGAMELFHFYSVTLKMDENGYLGHPTSCHYRVIYIHRNPAISPCKVGGPHVLPRHQ